MARGMGKIMTWQHLSWLEWQRSLWAGKPNRDFFWLTLLLTLTLLLAMLLWGTQRGLLNQFIDVSIGSVEGTGIPIWVAADTVAGINRDMLDTVPFKLHPYREVSSSEVALIDANQIEQDNQNPIWRSERTSEKVSFTGWAVSFNDPLWKMAANNISDKVTTSTLPLSIILNKSLFKKYFNCEAYIEQLQKQQPFWQPAEPLTTFAKEAAPYCLKSKKGKEELWLDIKIGENRQLIPFQIIWQPTIPTLQDLAFVFPLSTLNTITLSRYYLGLDYSPEAQAYQTALVKEVMWQGFDETKEKFALDKIKNCFAKNINKNASKGSRLTFNPLITEQTLAQCTQHHQIPLKTGNKKLFEDFLQITNKSPLIYKFKYDVNTNWLTIACVNDTNHCRPCEKTSDISQALNDLSGKMVFCEKVKNQLKIDMIAAVGGYSYAFAYVEKREDLASKVKEIKSFRVKSNGDRVFYIHSSYEDALVRFMFMDKIMKILEIFYSPFFLIFLVILLTVQIGIVVTHRCHNYGIYLSKGISNTEIRLLVLKQMALSLLVAVSVTVGIVELMQWLLAGQVFGVANNSPFVDHIIAGKLDLLPVSWQDYLLVNSIFIVLLYSITEILLYRLISSQHGQPAYLIG